jgi:hypothetical protein
MPLISELVFVWSVDHLAGESLLGRIAFLLRDLCGLDFEHVAHRGFLDEIFRLRRDPRAELTPVFSPADCANAAVERKIVPRAMMASERFMVESFKLLRR